MSSIRLEERALRSLAVKTILVTPSGALSPGPLSLSALAAGVKLGVVGGLLVATGHVLVELPYILILVRGVSRVRRVLLRLEKPLAIIMAAFILFFAYLLVRDAIVLTTSSYKPSMQVSTAVEALLYGIVFTGSNVYFLLWWVSVGLPLVTGAAELGARGVAVMYAAHVWMDYAWLGLLAAVASSVSSIGGPVYAAFLMVLAIVLIVFAVDTLLAAFARRRILPL